MRLDLLHLSRSLRRSPASATAAVLTLSLTLGSVASIFAVVDAVLLTPPPFADPDALVLVGELPIDEPLPAGEPRAVGYATFESWRERAGALATLEGFDGTNLTLTGIGAAERVSATDVTPGFLTLLGITPALGRALVPDDIGTPVAILGDAFWRGQLSGDPAVIGRQIVLGGRAHTIVGVLPEAFTFALNTSDLWRPLPVTPAQAVRTGSRVRVMARVAGNASPVHLSAALDDVSRVSSPPARVVATPVAKAIAGDSRTTLGLLAGAAALALVIAVANVAGLLMVRSVDRRRELAVRTALGAGPSETARQLLLEAAALVTLGTTAGVVLALWMTPAAGRLALEQFGSIANRDVAVSWRVIGVVAAVAFGCAGICGCLPALGTARRNAADVLRLGATSSPREVVLRRVFVAAEVALAFVLLVSMGLLGQTLWTVLNLHPGFDARGVVTLQVSLPPVNYPSAERVSSFYEALQNAVEDRLGRGAVSIVDELPLTGDRGRSLVSLRRTDPGRQAVVRTVSRGYFDVMRIPVIAGRAFGPEDDADPRPRVLISESLAQKLVAFEQPVGREIWLAASGQTAQIIGIVGDVKHRALDEASWPTVYFSALQAPSHSSIVVVRSGRPAADVIDAVREEVGRLDAALPVYRTRAMQDLVAASPGMPARRLLAATFTAFALLAVVLSAIGLFGVAAHDVASRRVELALRLALGADPGRLLRRTLAQGVVMVGIGLSAGCFLSIWVARGLSGVLFTTARADILSIGLAAGVLVVTGAVAILPAALRAARTDPLMVFRGE